jgi:hypothetical protein
MQDWSSDIEFTIKNKNLCKEGDWYANIWTQMPRWRL